MSIYPWRKLPDCECPEKRKRKLEAYATVRSKETNCITETAGSLPPTVLVIFGGGGDLTWRKLTPALCDLCLVRSLPERFAVIAVDRSELSDEKLRERLHDGVAQFSRRGKAGGHEWNSFAGHFSHLSGDFKDAQTYSALKQQIEALEGQWQHEAQRIFYMATPPAMFRVIPERLAETNLAGDVGRSRLRRRKAYRVRR